MPIIIYILGGLSILACLFVLAACKLNQVVRREDDEDGPYGSQ
jgi:hypothetical protein